MTPHPAKFSEPILAEIRYWLWTQWHRPPLYVLDPFAGVGGIHDLRDYGYATYGIELEPEWANEHPFTIVGDATALPYTNNYFDVIATSPCYGNRMADHHEARDDSKRLTYRHTLGRPLSENSAGAMQWGDAYRELHVQAWREATRVLKPGGLFILNCSNHIRNHKLQGVTEWHLTTLFGMGFQLIEAIPIRTKRMRFGANGATRAKYETLAFLTLTD